MITLKSSRTYVQVVKENFFPYINLYKKTRINNVAHHNIISEEYLSAVVINCLLSEIEQLLSKKLINTSGKNIKFDFTDAQGVLLYRTLIALPLPADNVYFQL